MIYFFIILILGILLIGAILATIIALYLRFVKKEPFSKNFFKTLLTFIIDVFTFT
ncbi:hypothetical protein IMAU10239_02883 [Lactiplantibacillus plantarum]|nr:hypothetical protein [Lactiplantibacillus plantarum]MCG0915493.1 hypothetical protein [Lactiplantibacillus plantarum]